MTFTEDQLEYLRWTFSGEPPPYIPDGYGPVLPDGEDRTEFTIPSGGSQRNGGLIFHCRAGSPDCLVRLLREDGEVRVDVPQANVTTTLTPEAEEQARKDLQSRIALGADPQPSDIPGHPDDSTIGTFSRSAAAIREGLARSVLLGEAPVHAGRGIDHMAGLSHLVDEANLAGDAMPHVVMRTDDNEALKLHLQGDVRSIVSRAAALETRIESGHNVIMGKRRDLDIIRRDDAREIDERWKAHIDMARQWANYETLLAEEMAAYDPEKAPEDLQTYREWAIERLEARTMARIKSFKRAVTQQGVDSAAACDDEADATTAAALAGRNGATAIWNADTIPEAEAAFDTAVVALEAIVPLNIPEWQMNGADAIRDGQTANWTLTTTDRALTIQPVNPSRTDAEGPLGIYPDWKITDANGQDPGQVATRSGVKLTTAIPDTATFPVTVEVRGRNTCGDSALTVTVESDS